MNFYPFVAKLRNCIVRTLRWFALPNMFGYANVSACMMPRQAALATSHDTISQLCKTHKIIKQKNNGHFLNSSFLRKNSYLKSKCRDGFTFLEILIVIAIISIMAVMAVQSFGSARQKAKIDLLTDNLVSVVQQQEGQAKSGKSPSCFGVEFHASQTGAEAVSLFTVPYKSVDGLKADFCDTTNIQQTSLEDMKGFTIVSIDESQTLEDNAPTMVNSLVFVFKPPFGKLVMGEDVDTLTPPEKYSPIAHPIVKITVREENGKEARTFMVDTTTLLVQKFKPVAL